MGAFGFAISPDSSRVVFSAEQGGPAAGLYSVPITGTVPIKISGPSSSSLQADDFEISSDSSRVVYRSNDEVFSAPIGGGSAPVTLNSALVTGGSVQAFVISPDGSRVLYLADQDIDQAIDLYSVPIGGGTVVKLGGPSHASNRLFVHLTADSSRAIYGTDQDTPGVTEIYSVPIGGGAAVKLNDALPTGKQVIWFQISPNSDRLVYSTSGGVGAEPGMDQLFSVPSSGGAVVPLTSSLIGAGTLHSFLFTPDGSQVIYQADQDNDGHDELYALEAQPLLLNGIGQLQHFLYLPIVRR
jgi:Tol biopolymer transport system component